MKRLLSLFAFLSFFHWSFSQEYIPFPLQNVAWHNGEYSCDELYEDCFSSFHNYKTDGDTVINGYEMSKVITSSPGSWDLGQSSSNFIGALREDSTKVYFKPWYQDEEELLFNFSLSIGDTAHVFGLGLEPELIEDYISDYVVEEVYYENFNGINRKVIKFPLDRWIEGIGSSVGIFRGFGPYFSGVYGLQECVYVDGEMIYHNDFGELNCGVLSTSENELNVAIYPNPAIDHFTIKGIQGNAILEIRDLRGRLIQSENINSSAQIINLDNELNSGIYLVRISSGAKQFTQRLLIE